MSSEINQQLGREDVTKYKAASTRAMYGGRKSGGCKVANGWLALPEIVAGQGNVSSVISTSAQHQSARGGLELASGVVVARPDFLAADLQVAAARRRALVFPMVVEVPVAVPHVVTAADRLDRVHCKIRGDVGALELH